MKEVHITYYGKKLDLSYITENLTTIIQAAEEANHTHINFSRITTTQEYDEKNDTYITKEIHHPLDTNQEFFTKLNSYITSNFPNLHLIFIPEYKDTNTQYGEYYLTINNTPQGQHITIQQMTQYMNNTNISEYQQAVLILENSNQQVPKIGTLMYYI